ncbi:MULTISPECIES: hypothetical protein [Achromobacter]|uniref:hypothetical protein n=1 Tax=Achromobacter TaxID=222 RepID=UPI00244C1F55|nr:hypothetical protein [Achromobacter mucicolens]MDH0094915.1 hypothetical protein [Achromobacter mucicolens]
MLESSPLFKVSGTNQSAVRLANCSGPMMDPRQQAIGQLLAAMANASNALGKRLASKTHTLVGLVHSAALLRYAGQHVTQIVVSKNKNFND